MSKRWYVIRTYSGHEKRVKDAIEHLLANNNTLKKYFGDILIPSQKTFVIRDGKKLVREKKLFPSYIIIEMEVTPETYNFVLNIPSIMNFLGPNKNPQALSKKEVNRLLGIKEYTEYTKKQERFLIDERVKIIDGAFKDFEGVVNKIDENRGKLSINVTVFGRITPVEVRYEQVESLNK